MSSVGVDLDVDCISIILKLMILLFDKILNHSKNNHSDTNFRQFPCLVLCILGTNLDLLL